MFIKNRYIFQGGKVNLIMSELKIENIVFSANLAEKIDIQYVSKQFVNSKYNIDEFSGLILDFDNPNCAVFLFSNGKITCTGIKNFDDIEIIINRIISDIEGCKITIFDDINIEIVNIIASSRFANNFNLGYIKDQIIFENIVDNSNDFPGLIYNIPDLAINVIIFNSGKIIFTGGKELEDIKKVLRMLKENLANIGVL